MNQNDENIDWEVSVNDGKYTVRYHYGGGMSFLRNGEIWGAGNEKYIFSNLVYWLAVELKEARDQIEYLDNKIDFAIK